MIPAIINIMTADIIGEYKLHLTFDDGTQQTIDFRPFLIQSIHPAIRTYLDPKQFSDFRIVHGELVWGDYDLCFPMIDLYQNQLFNKHSFGQVA